MEARSENAASRHAAAGLVPGVAPAQTGNQMLLRSLAAPALRPSRMPMLQRECMCGGTCPSCKDDTAKLQTKLAINEPGDESEQEADRVADRVMRMAEPAVHDKVETGLLQRRASGTATADGVPPSVGDVLRSPGRPLDAETRAFMEPRFGADFGAVRV